jgi:sugar phosphate isomerase/epimerase
MIPALTPTCSVSLVGLVLRPAAPWGGDARSALAWACASGVQAVQIDATMPGLRPRELDTSARRDIRALARRQGVTISGVDLFIPPTHFIEAANIDRAMHAARAALELARDLAEDASTAQVATELPEKLAESTLADLRSSAQQVGASLADCAWPPRAIASSTHADVRIGIDPAAVFATGQDLLASIAKLPGTPVHARLSDLSASGRVEAGKGRLDIMTYYVTLSTKGYAAPLVIDLRGLRDQENVLERIIARTRQT